MPLFNKNRRRNGNVNSQFSISDVLETRVLLSASHSDDNGREDDRGGNDGNDDNDNGVNDDGANDDVTNENIDNGQTTEIHSEASNDSDAESGVNSNNDNYGDGGNESRGILTGAGRAIGEVQFESEIEHGQQQQSFEVEVRGLTPGSSHSVTVDGVEVGTVTVGNLGYGRLKLSSTPNRNESPFPENFPSIVGSTEVTVGSVLSGTVANSNPATQSPSSSNGDGSDHLRLNLISTGAIQGRAKFEDSSAGSQQEFQVEVWNAVRGEQLSVDVDGVTVGQITVNALGHGVLSLGNEDGRGGLPANWPGVTSGSVVSVGAELSGVFAGFGQVADASPAEFQEAYDLDQRLELQATGNLFENWGGAGEKWFHGDGGWYFITPDGSLYLWNGQSGANGDLIANLDASFFDNPELLYNSTPAGTATIDDDVARITAADLDHDLNLTTDGNYYENWGGLGEKWLRGDGGWYYVTPDGSVYQWTRGSGMNDTLVAGLDSRYHADPTLLTNALQNLSVEEAAYAISQGLNLRTTPNDFLNWGGRNEKWLKGDSWYFITEDGGFYSWDGKPMASGTLITTLSATYYNDLSLLTPTTAIVRPDLNGMLDTVFADIADLLQV
jgi:hypothetical protein